MCAKGNIFMPDYHHHHALSPLVLTDFWPLRRINMKNLSYILQKVLAMDFLNLIGPSSVKEDIRANFSN